MANGNKRDDGDERRQQIGPALDSEGEPGRGEDSIEQAVGVIGTCAVCGSALAANGQCPDCGGPGEEPEGLDSYGCGEDESAGRASCDSAAATQPETPEGGAGPTSPVAGPTVPRMTIEEFWEQGEEIHQRISPARARALIDAITKMSEDAGSQVRPDGLGWLQRIANDGAKPTT